jgi:hypothetical protein
MTNRWFTPVAARLALRRVRPAAETMCRIYRRLKRWCPARIASDQPVEPRYFDGLLALHDALETLGDLGVQVKDPAEGLIGFPSRREGRAVVLCWKVGEPTLGFWHEVGAGPAGRRPVDEDGPWDAEEAG